MRAHFELKIVRVVLHLVQERATAFRSERVRSSAFFSKSCVSFFLSSFFRRVILSRRIGRDRNVLRFLLFLFFLLLLFGSEPKHSCAHNLRRLPFRPFEDHLHAPQNLQVMKVLVKSFIERFARRLGVLENQLRRLHSVFNRLVQIHLHVPRHPRVLQIQRSRRVVHPHTFSSSSSHRSVVLVHRLLHQRRAEAVRIQPTFDAFFSLFVLARQVPHFASNFFFPSLDVLLFPSLDVLLVFYGVFIVVVVRGRGGNGNASF